MDTNRILFLATPKAYDLINASETNADVKLVLEHAFNLYERARLGIKSSILHSTRDFPLSVYTRWAEMPYDKHLILICDGGFKAFEFMLESNDVLAHTVETALPVLSH